MEDRWVAALAVSVAVGALWSLALPAVAVVAVVAGALVWRRPVVWCLAGAVLASFLGARSWSGLTPPAVAEVHGVVTVLGDPSSLGPATRLLVRVDGRRAEAWGRAAAGGVLGRARPGERLLVSGTIGPVPQASRARAAVRHVSARLSVDRAEALGGAPPAYVAAERVRTVLARGAAAMGERRAALFLGMVLGDDGAIDPRVVDDMRAAGLGHLTAVSGQNVAFLLLAVGPALGRLPASARLPVTAAVLAAFCLLTRFEPSVLRAAGMAAVAAVAVGVARPASGLRVLALAVAGLVLVDPMLVRSPGFALSGAATLGLLLLAGPVARVLPGPRPLATALGVTIAAQAGVLPLSLWWFGGVPPVSLVTNVLAVPLAGPLLVWGLTAGLVAGLGPPSVAGVLHLPTGWVLDWITTVARVGAAVPLGNAGVPAVLAVGAALGAAGLAGRRSGGARVVLRGLAVVTAVTGLVVLPARAAIPRPMVGIELGGAVVWSVPEHGRRAATVVVVRRGDAHTADALRAAGVVRADVVVIGGADAELVARAAGIADRLSSRVVLAPPGAAGTIDGRPGTGTPEVPVLGDVVAVGRLEVLVTDVAARRLTVDVRIT